MRLAYVPQTTVVVNVGDALDFPWRISVFRREYKASVINALADCTHMSKIARHAFYPGKIPRCALELSLNVLPCSNCRVSFLHRPASLD